MQLIKSDSSFAVEDLSLLPVIDWDKKMHGDWDISEQGGQDR